MAIAENLPLHRIQQRWNDLTLARQFALAGGAVLIIGMLVIGVWVTQQIQASVTRNTAVATALYVDSMIAPLLPNVGGGVLSDGARRALDETLSAGALGERIASFKIWVDDGLIAYASNPELIGRTFPPGEALLAAWAGEVTAEFDELDEEESAAEREAGVPLLEIYSPIREPWSGTVLGVAEFYERATELEETLRTVRLRSWLVVAAVTLCMLALLSGIVLRGSSLIDSQRRTLERRVSELSALLRQNEALRLRVQRASSRAVALNERYLRRISADLHDGPAQLLALASLRLGEDGGAGDRELTAIRATLDNAMQEIRDICRGLTLPKIEAMSFAEIVQTAVRAHENVTGTHVELDLPETAPALGNAQKICVFRFVQEGLSNAFRHAGGAGQRISAATDPTALRVEVADSGNGFGKHAVGDDGLGLAGLRERVESLGGEFKVESSSSGTRLAMTLRLDEENGR